MTPESEMADLIEPLYKTVEVDPTRLKALAIAAKYKAEAAAAEAAKTSSISSGDIVIVILLCALLVAAIALLLNIFMNNDFEDALTFIFYKLPKAIYMFIFTFIMILLGIVMYFCTLGCISVTIHTDTMGVGKIAAWPMPLIDLIVKIAKAEVWPGLWKGIKKELRFIVMISIALTIGMFKLLIVRILCGTLNALFVKPRLLLIEHGIKNKAVWGWE